MIAITKSDLRVAFAAWLGRDRGVDREAAALHALETRLAQVERSLDERLLLGSPRKPRRPSR